MGAYDKSCEAYYEESLSLFPNEKLNRSAYSQLEYLHRVHHLNRTGRMEVRACDTASPHGCCLACNVPNCCLCAYDGEADLRRDLETVPAIKNYSYMPPGGFLAWHTNRFDNNRVPYRIYLISVDRDSSSSFKYLQPWSELVEVKDFNGAVRLFKNT